jgi:hypothetical protein
LAYAIVKFKSAKSVINALFNIEYLIRGNLYFDTNLLRRNAYFEVIRFSATSYCFARISTLNWGEYNGESNNGIASKSKLISALFILGDCSILFLASFKSEIPQGFFSTSAFLDHKASFTDARFREAS